MTQTTAPAPILTRHVFTLVTFPNGQSIKFSGDLRFALRDEDVTTQLIYAHLNG